MPLRRSSTDLRLTRTLIHITFHYMTDSIPGTDDPRLRPFAAFLRAERAKRALTQGSCAERLGVSVRTVASWESGTAEPKTIADVRRLAAWTGTPTADIYPLIRDLDAPNPIDPS